MHDVARLLVPGRTLSLADVALLASALKAPAWQVRQARLDARDAAVREALAVLAPSGPTNAARRVARAWAALARGSVTVPEIAGPLRRAAELHGDAPPPSWEQIARIGRSGRTPDACA